jgi:hypothetical protein
VRGAAWWRGSGDRDLRNPSRKPSSRGRDE